MSKRPFILLLGLLSVAAVFPPQPARVSVSLAWDHPSEDVTFCVYYGTNALENCVAVGAVRQVTLTNIQRFPVPSFAVRAVNEGGESDFSNVVSLVTTNYVAPVRVVIQQESPGPVYYTFDLRTWALLGYEQRYTFTNPPGAWYFHGTNRLTITREPL